LDGVCCLEEISIKDSFGYSEDFECNESRPTYRTKMDDEEGNTHYLDDKGKERVHNCVPTRENGCWFDKRPWGFQCINPSHFTE